MPADGSFPNFGTGQKSSSSGVWIDHSGWAEAQIPMRPWVAPGYLLKRAVTLLAGPPSAMKSSLLLAWAVATALGREHGPYRPTESGVVIVYNVEDDQFEQRRRLSASLRVIGAAPADIAGKVIRIGPHEVGTLIEHDRETGLVRMTNAMLEIKQVIEQYKPVALFADPFSELHTAEENDNTAVRAVIARFRSLAVEHEMAVCLVHHTRKGASGAAGDPDSARGASAIIGAVRCAFTLTTMSEEDAKAFGMRIDRSIREYYFRLDSAKANYAPLGRAVWYEKALHKLDNGETVPAAEPWEPPAEKIASQVDLTALAEAIAKGLPDGMPYSPKLSKEARSVRPLLQQFEFFGSAQKTVLTRLLNEAGVAINRFRKSSNRTEAQGLHVDFRPPADWIRSEGNERPDASP
jgi:RecA-family ATPase